MPITPVLERLTQDNLELEATLGYTARPYLKKKKGMYL
jgi:hypothetical protein